MLWEVQRKVTLLKRKVPVGENEQIKCGLAWAVLLLTMIRVITVVKICCGLAAMTHIVVDKIACVSGGIV